MSKKTFVISDIHGRLDLLDLCLARIVATDTSGTVIFTGDYIDRGPDSSGVIQRLIDGPPDGWVWKFIRGNHEDFLLDAMGGGDPSCWMSNGGLETLQSYGMCEPDSHHVDWVDGLPRLLWDDLRVYTHAAVSEAYELTEQPEAVTQWQRYPNGADIGYRGKHVVHGHTPQINGPELYQNRTNLDIGGVFSGRMCIGVFDQTQAAPIYTITVKSE